MSADLDMSKRDNLIIHIEGLQATLTKRNARIAELEKLLAGEGANEREMVARARAFKKGWESCANSVMNEAATAINAIQSLKNAGFHSSLEADKLP